MRLPDLLGQLFPPSHLLQLDQVHLICLAGVLKGKLRLLVLAQNTRDRAGWMHLRLTPVAGRGALAVAIRPLRIEIGPAAILMARLDVPLRASAYGGDVRLLIKGSALIRAGHVIRPQRRAPVHRRVRPPFAGGLPLWPRRPSIRHWVMRGRPCVRVKLGPLCAADAPDPLHCCTSWQVGELWVHEDTSDTNELADRIRGAMGEADCPLLCLGMGITREPSGVLKAAP